MRACLSHCVRVNPNPVPSSGSCRRLRLSTAPTKRSRMLVIRAARLRQTRLGARAPGRGALVRLAARALSLVTAWPTNKLWRRGLRVAPGWDVPLAYWLACADCDSVDILARSRQRQASALALSPRQHLKVLIAIPLAPRALTTGLGDGHPGQKRPMIADDMGVLDGDHASPRSWRFSDNADVK